MGGGGGGGGEEVGVDRTMVTSPFPHKKSFRLQAMYVRVWRCTH